MKRTIQLNGEEFNEVESACSIIQTLEHMYDGFDKYKMERLGEVYDILTELLEDNKGE